MNGTKTMNEIINLYSSKHSFIHPFNHSSKETNDTNNLLLHFLLVQ